MTLDLARYKALSFDCYGTLIDWEAGIVAAVERLARPHGAAPAPEAILASLSRHETKHQAANPAWLYPRILAATYQDMAADLNIPYVLTDALAFGASVGDWPAFPDSAKALAYLKQHYKLVILSNIDRDSFARSNKRLGVEFDLIVTAQDVGTYKPDTNNFKVMLEKLAAVGVPREGVLHVAQSLYHDHVPAKAVGLPTVWINRRSGNEGWGATPAAEATPDLTVPTLEALAAEHRRQTGG